jgi:glycerophosphoryl diester phosphodiesterase
VAVVAHRGASAHAPEHTVAAYDLALELGADGIELDVRLAADGRLVVFHDPTLARTAREGGAPCRGRVAERTVRDLARLDVGSWLHPRFAGLRPLTLGAALRRYAGRTQLHVEVKDPAVAPGIEDALVAALSPHRSRGGLLVQSFDGAWLERLRARDADLPLLQLFGDDEGVATVRRRLPRLAHARIGVGACAARVDARLVRAAHERGLPVRVYTVNDPAEMARLVALGVDAIFTDAPDRLRAILAAQPSAAASLARAA